MGICDEATLGSYIDVATSFKASLGNNIGSHLTVRTKPLK